MSNIINLNDLSKLVEYFKIPEDEPGVVNVLLYCGEVYGVYNRREDAYNAALKKFGHGALDTLTATVRRIKVE